MLMKLSPTPQWMTADLERGPDSGERPEEKRMRPGTRDPYRKFPDMGEMMMFPRLLRVHEKLHSAAAEAQGEADSRELSS
jgi:hypothetical protein